MNAARPMVNTIKDKNVSAVKQKAVVNAARPKAVVNAVKGNDVNVGNPQMDLQDQGVIDSGCSRHMTGNMSYLTDYEEIDGGYVAFGGNPKGGKITGKVPRKNNMYSVDLNNIVPKGGLTCLFSKATSEESKLWHRRLGHINFKTMNKLTRIVEENPHVQFSENAPNITRSRPNWLFDIDALTKSMNYKLVVTGNQSNGNVVQRVLLMLDLNLQEMMKKKVTEDPRKENKCDDQEEEDNVNMTNNVNAASINEVNAVGGKTSIELPNDPNMPELEDNSIFKDDEDVGAEADMNNLDTTIQEELLQFKLQEVWTLVDLLIGKMVIGTKWVFRNKKDERGIVIRNKARLVAQGYTQEEGIDYDEVSVPVARIEAIRLFLAYASFKDFVVYQMDVKSDFLYGKIEEEVYVCQPLGFEDSDFPDRVYMVEKALYGLHQAPRAWYETLLTYLLDNEFQRGKIDKTLFIKRYKGDILLMSSMGELTFFFGLQIQQKKDGIFISQDKYVGEILKEFGFTKFKTASTPIETQKPLLKDEDGEEVDVHMYRSMIGSLMYLTSSRRDIMFAVCACARYQVTPKGSHLHAVKRIFWYLNGQSKLGLWYPKDFPFDLEAYTDSDYARASLDRKSTTGGCQFLGCRLISWQCKKQIVVANSTTKAEYVATLSCCRQSVKVNTVGEINAARHKLTVAVEILIVKVNAARHKLTTVGGVNAVEALVDGKKVIVIEASVRSNLHLDDEEGTDCLPNATIFEELTRIGTKKPRRTKNKDTQVPESSVPSDNVTDEDVYKELDDSLARAATTASSLEAEQDSGNITKTRSKATLNEPSCSRTSSGSGPRIADNDANKDIYLVNAHTDEDTFGVNDLDGDEVIVDNVDVVKTVEETRSVVEEVTAVIEEIVNVAATTTTTIITHDEITLAKALAELKSAKPPTLTTIIATMTIKADSTRSKAKGIVIHEEEHAPTPTVSSQQPSQVKV
ncbi:putative ribonuclease H-like domain-containing protein [Tanacetum coccineum]